MAVLRLPRASAWCGSLRSKAAAPARPAASAEAPRDVVACATVGRGCEDLLSLAELDELAIKEEGDAIRQAAGLRDPKRRHSARCERARRTALPLPARRARAPGRRPRPCLHRHLL
jgi:hypothetical protein